MYRPHLRPREHHRMHSTTCTCSDYLFISPHQIGKRISLKKIRTQFKELREPEGEARSKVT